MKSKNPLMHRPLMVRSVCAAWAALTLTALSVQAQPAGGDGPRKPPAEALAACKALASGQECSFTAPHGAVKGLCWAPEGKPLACRPEGAPAPGAGASKPAKP
jgi:hypothetical protein